MEDVHLKKAEEEEERKQRGEIAQQSQVAFGYCGWCSTTACSLQGKGQLSKGIPQQANEMPEIKWQQFFSL